MIVFCFGGYKVMGVFRFACSVVCGYVSAQNLMERPPLSYEGCRDRCYVIWYRIKKVIVQIHLGEVNAFC